MSELTAPLAPFLALTPSLPPWRVHFTGDSSRLLSSSLLSIPLNSISALNLQPFPQFYVPLIQFPSICFDPSPASLQPSHISHNKGSNEANG